MEEVAERGLDVSEAQALILRADEFLARVEELLAHFFSELIYLYKWMIT